MPDRRPRRRRDTAHAIRHTTTDGTVHTWTTSAYSAVILAGQLAVESGQPVDVLEDRGRGWRLVGTAHPTRTDPEETDRG